MFGTILRLIEFNNFGTRCLNGPRHLFHSFCCTIRHIFEPLRVFEPGFNTENTIPTYALLYTYFNYMTLDPNRCMFSYSLGHRKLRKMARTMIVSSYWTRQQMSWRGWRRSERKRIPMKDSQVCITYVNIWWYICNTVYFGFLGSRTISAPILLSLCTVI